MKKELALDRWLFDSGSPTALGLFRAVIGTFAAIDLSVHLPQYREWFTETGYFPIAGAQTWSNDNFRINFLNTVTSAGLVLALYLLMIAAAITTALGYKTRISSGILAVLLVAFHHRTPVILNSGDTLLRVSLIWLAIAPSGAGFSLDRSLALRKGKSWKDSICLCWPRVVQIQIALVYFATLWHKWYGPFWKDGTATFYPAHLAEFDRFWVPSIFDENLFFLRVETWGTLVAEFMLAVLVFYKPFRKWALLGGLLLHGYIEYRFNIPFFGWIICSTYICFYTGEEVEAWLVRVKAFWNRNKTVPQP